MYQALYRKYRPTNLDEIVGQDIIVKTLKNAITTDKLSHAYLFSGPRGTGKTSVAKILAKTVNCSSLKEHLPCMECISCMQDQQKQNIDIIEIDAASNNGVDEIREIRSKVNLVPSFGKYKIYIIDEVHMLTTGAFNALLKTLEEPPQHVIFVLATTEVYKIPSTIMSRCQRFDFKKVPLKGIEEHLYKIAKKENVELEVGVVEEIAKFSDGGMRDAIGLLDQAIAYAKEKITKQDIFEINGTLSEEMIHKLALTLINKDLRESLELFNSCYEDGKNLIKIVEDLMRYLKDVAFFDLSKEKSNISLDSQQRYTQILKNVPQKELIELIEEININFSGFKLSADSKLAVELFLIKRCKSSTYICDKNSDDEAPNSVEKEITIPLSLLNQESIEEKAQPVEMEDEHQIIEKLKEIRVGNTLSKFLKSEISVAKKIVSQIEKNILDEDSSSLVSIILDGDVKAASEESLVFVYKTEGSALFFNKNLLSIEKLVSKMSVKPYKLIAVSAISWEIIKDEFNNKKRKFEYIEEDENLYKKLNKKDEKVGKIKDIFSDIIEFE